MSTSTDTAEVLEPLVTSQKKNQCNQKMSDTKATFSVGAELASPAQPRSLRALVLGRCYDLSLVRMKAPASCSHRKGCYAPITRQKMSPLSQKQAEAVAAQWIQLCTLALNETITFSIAHSIIHSITPTPPDTKSSKEMTINLGSIVLFGERRGNLQIKYP